ncbi:MAG: hypothetical protein JW969_12870 [Spirochaetales bacterium]|nr:hypothetical protein [Spirochaetales bacterium]
MKKYLVFYTVLLILICPVTVFGTGNINVGGGIVAILNFDPLNGITGIVPALTVSFPVFTIDGSNSLNTRVTLWGAYYNWSGVEAVPSEEENREMLVTGCIGSLTYVYTLTMNPKWKLGLEAGAALLVRIPVSLAPAYDPLYPDFYGYFFGAFRFIMPDTGISASYQFADNLGLCLSAHALWPIFHLWDSEGANFFNQTVITGLFEIIVNY